MGFFQSVGEILSGDGSNGGQRHEHSDGHASYTRGPASDSQVPPGSTYLSVSGDAGKRTEVFDSDGAVVKDTGWHRK